MGAIALVVLAACDDGNSVAVDNDINSSSSESIISSSSVSEPVPESSSESEPAPESSGDSEVSSSSESEVSSSSSKPTPESSSDSEVSSNSVSEPVPESSSESEPIPESSSERVPLTCLHRTSLEVLCFIAPETASPADFNTFCAEENGTIGIPCPDGKTLECVGPRTGNTIYYYDEIAPMMGCEIMMSARD